MSSPWLDGTYLQTAARAIEECRELTLSRVIVIEFVTLDGIVEDPDGSQGTPAGGWAFRHGPDTVAGDKFGLGSILDSGVLLLGRVTWELFATIWPGRSDEFASAMNRIPKLVASRSGVDVEAWSNSEIIDGDVFATADQVRRRRDVIVAGSTSVVHALAARDLVDEYRLLVFPTVLGRGERLFPADTATDLRLVSSDEVGAAVLLRYERCSTPA